MKWHVVMREWKRERRCYCIMITPKVRYLVVNQQRRCTLCVFLRNYSALMFFLGLNNQYLVDGNKEHVLFEEYLLHLSITFLFYLFRAYHSYILHLFVITWVCWSSCKFEIILFWNLSREFILYCFLQICLISFLAINSNYLKLLWWYFLICSWNECYPMAQQIFLLSNLVYFSKKG